MQEIKFVEQKDQRHFSMVCINGEELATLVDGSLLSDKQITSNKDIRIDFVYTLTSCRKLGTIDCDSRRLYVEKKRHQ